MGQLVSDVSKILDYQDSKKDAKSERQKILAQIAEDEKTKTNLVKKVLAEQRAKYGANGNNGNSFSENAVLKRLREETSKTYDEKYKNNMEKIKKTKANKKPNIIKNWLSKIDDIAG